MQRGEEMPLSLQTGQLKKPPHLRTNTDKKLLMAGDNQRLESAQELMKSLPVC